VPFESRHNSLHEAVGRIPVEPVSQAHVVPDNGHVARIGRHRDGREAVQVQTVGEVVDDAQVWLEDDRMEALLIRAVDDAGGIGQVHD